MKHKIFHTIHFIHWAKLLSWFDVKCSGEGRNLEGVIGKTCICSKGMSKVGVAGGQEQLWREMETGSRWGLCFNPMTPVPQLLPSRPSFLLQLFRSDKIITIIQIYMEETMGLLPKTVFVECIFKQWWEKEQETYLLRTYSVPDTSQEPFHLISEFHEICVLVAILQIKTLNFREVSCPVPHSS